MIKLQYRFKNINNVFINISDSNSESTKDGFKWSMKINESFQNLYINLFMTQASVNPAELFCDYVIEMKCKNSWLTSKLYNFCYLPKKSVDNIV